LIRHICTVGSQPGSRTTANQDAAAERNKVIACITTNMTNNIETLDLLKSLFGDLIKESVREVLAERKPEKKYLTNKELKDLLGVTNMTLYNWTKKGTIKAHRIGNRVLYDSGEIQDAIEQGELSKYKKVIERQRKEADYGTHK
jgi:excisionase family DNA binding protein